MTVPGTIGTAITPWIEYAAPTARCQRKAEPTVSAMTTPAAPAQSKAEDETARSSSSTSSAPARTAYRQA